MSEQSEHPNATRVRALFAAFRAADLETITSTIAAGAVWHFPGRKGRIAGAHRGRDAILRFLLDVMVLTDNSFHLDLIDVLANDRRVVVLFRGSGRRNGKTLDNPTCLHLVFDDHQVVEVWEYVWNLYDVDEFWA